MPENYAPGSVTQWIEDLRNEDPDATTRIWERFVNRLAGVARKRLRGSPCRHVGEDEVASDALRDFFKRGPSEFARLIDRNDLWQILVQIAECRAYDAIRAEMSLGRGGGRVVNASAIGSEGSDEWMHTKPGDTPPPDVELELLEAFDERLAALPMELRQIAMDRLEGWSNKEIAQKRGIALRSVERKLAEVRQIWRETDRSDQAW